VRISQVHGRVMSCTWHFSLSLFPLPTSSRCQDCYKITQTRNKTNTFVRLRVHKEIQRVTIGLQEGLLVISIEIPYIMVINTHRPIFHHHLLYESLCLKDQLLHGEHCLVTTILLLQAMDEDRSYWIDELWIGHLWNSRRRMDGRWIEDDPDDGWHIDHVPQPNGKHR